MMKNNFILLISNIVKLIYLIIGFWLIYWLNIILKNIFLWVNLNNLMISEKIHKNFLGKYIKLMIESIEDKERR